VTQHAEHLGDEVLSALVDDQLSRDERAPVQAHLGDCSVCQQRLEELRSVVSLLRSLPDVDVPRDFSLGPRVVADPPNIVRLRRWYTATRIGAATLAAGFLFLSAGALYVDSRPAVQPVQLSAPAPAAQQAPAAPTVAVRSAAPPAAPQASPAAGVAAAARPARANPQPDDQVAAATSINPLPTLVPTPRPTVVVLPVPVRVTTDAADPAAPLRGGAIVIGLVAVLTLLAALIVRHRLQQAASHL
jgi:anti-sigma factor RsiW